MCRLRKHPCPISILAFGPRVSQQPGSSRVSRPIESRPEFYDFDLFAHAGASADQRERPLGELAYTAFDMETTGLAPSAGDES